MNYEIKGAPMPVVECTLEAGESIKCEGGSMSWMTPNMKMETTGGGIGKMFTKAISGEKLFQNILIINLTNLNTYLKKMN